MKANSDIGFSSKEGFWENMDSLCVYMCMCVWMYIWRWKGCYIADITTLVFTIFWCYTFIFLPESQREFQFDREENKKKCNSLVRGEIAYILLKNNPEDPDDLVKLKYLWRSVHADGGKLGETL